MRNTFIDGLISRMSIEQKIGSLLTLGFAGTLARPHIREQILKYHCGGLRLTPHARLFGSYVDPKTNKSVVDVTDNKGYRKDVGAPYTDAKSYAKVLSDLQDLAKSRPLGLPLHFSFDQEGGTSADYNFGGVNLFPKPMGIRATNDPELAYLTAKAIARQSKAVGFSWIHSPVLDVNTEPNNPEIYTRSYSDDPDEVAEYAVKACLGFKEMKMIATGKHFPGRGDSAADAHFQTPVIDVDKDTLVKRELYPYKALIERDLLPSIMIAHSIFPALDPDNVATVSKKILTGLLRDEMNFNGVITTDSMTMGAIAVKYGVANACAMALEAGADLVLMKAENRLVEDTVNKIRAFVDSGRITMDALNEKVYRVLSTKYEYGIFTDFSREDPDEVIKDRQIIELSKTVAKRSVMIEKQTCLPLSKDEKSLVIEQINKTSNDLYWHPGILYMNCAKYSQNIEYLETAYTFDERDKELISARVKDHNTVIITNFYIRGSLANNDFIAELVKDKSKRFIIITNTPYPISVPEGADNLIITYSTTPRNIEVTAGAIFGEIIPEGVYPIKWKNGNENNDTQVDGSDGEGDN